MYNYFQWKTFLAVSSLAHPAHSSQSDLNAKLPKLTVLCNFNI